MKKNLLLLAVLATTTMFGFTACSNDDDNDGGNTTPIDDTTIRLPEQPNKEDALKLHFTESEPVDYHITDEQGETSYNITELELTESSYYFIKLEKQQAQNVKTTRADSQPDYFYLWGIYFKQADGSYELAGFGNINIRINEDGSAQVTMTIVTSAEGSRTVSVRVLVTLPNNDNSQETLNLCRDWDVVSTRVQIEGISAFYQEEGCNFNSIIAYIKQHANVKDNLAENQKVEKINFSDNGTFAILYINEWTDRATWSWVSKTDGRFQFAWDFGDMGYSFIDRSASIKINPAGTPSQLKLTGTVMTNEGEMKPITTTLNIQ